MASTPEASQNSFCCVFGCFAPFFVAVALGMAWMTTGAPLQQAKDAGNWVAAPCVIKSSQVRTTRSGRTASYSIDVRYDYTWNGQPLEGNRYSFELGSNVGVGEMQKVVDSLPPGTRTTCYVNPDRPAESVLSRDATSSLWVGLVPLGILVIFSGIGYGLWRYKPRSP